MYSRLIRHNFIMLAHYLPAYLHLQLVLTLLSWPLLRAWGLPISLGLFLGNLIFAPLLTLFLGLSSLLFFLTLLCLPVTPVAYLLTNLSDLWWLLQATGSRSWLTSIAHPPASWSYCIPLITLALIVTPCSQRNQSAFLCLLFGISGLLLPRLQKDAHSTLPYFTQELTLLRSGTQGILIDPGILGRRISACSQITRTLVPFLTTHGITTLSAVIVGKPSLQVYKAVTTLLRSCSVEKVYISSLSTTLNRTWSAWEDLLRTAAQHNTTIIVVTTPYAESVGSHQVNISLGSRQKTRNMAYQPLVIDYRQPG